MLIALSIAELTMPWISHLIGADMQIAYLGKGGMLLPALGLFAVTGLLGGLYPAIYLSRFKPAQVLRTGRTSAETAGSGRLRATLVVVQFAIAIGLVASTAVIYSQTRFIERVDPGYRRDGLIQIGNGWRFTQGAPYEAARADMLAIPGVVSTGRAGLELGAAETPVRLMRTPGAAQYQTMGFHSIDADYLQTLGVELLAGRMLGDRYAAAGGRRARHQRGGEPRRRGQVRLPHAR
jgi:putative ABC transport system permease protein